MCFHGCVLVMTGKVCHGGQSHSCLHGNENMCPVMSCFIWCDPCRAASCEGEGDSQFVALCLHQHPLQLHARGGGVALPFLLAAHLHPSAARLHAGHSLLSHSLPGGAAVQLFTQTEGAARGRGQYCYLWFPFIFTIFSLFLYWIQLWQMWTLLSLLMNFSMWFSLSLFSLLFDWSSQLPKTKIICN